MATDRPEYNRSTLNFTSGSRMYDILMVDEQIAMLEKLKLRDYIVWAGCIQSSHVSPLRTRWINPAPGFVFERLLVTAAHAQLLLRVRCQLRYLRSVNLQAIVLGSIKRPVSWIYFDRLLVITATLTQGATARRCSLTLPAPSLHTERVLASSSALAMRSVKGPSNLDLDLPLLVIDGSILTHVVPAKRCLTDCYARLEECQHELPEWSRHIT